MIPYGRHRAGARPPFRLTHSCPNVVGTLSGCEQRRLFPAPQSVRRRGFIEAAARVVPDLRSAIHLCLPGTPVTFNIIPGGRWGWWVAFPSRRYSPLVAPRVGFANLWLVGDSIFPGQSTAGVTLGALRVAAEVAAAGRRLTRHVHTATLANHEVTTHE